MKSNLRLAGGGPLADLAAGCFLGANKQINNMNK